VKKSIMILATLLLCLTMFTSCDLIIGLFSKTGFVTGYVYDAGTTNGVSGVVVTASGTSESTTTNASGYFTIELPEGSQTLHFSKTGYTFYDIVIAVVADDTVDLSEDVVGYTPLASGEIRIVLTWNENPSDLDSHLYVPVIADEVYYSHKTASDGSANLDWDDTTSYGPETITISSQKSAGNTYYYSVYHYSGSGTIGASGAVVKVYNSSGLWKTYNVSGASGDGSKLWWRVFSLNGSTITDLNAFSDSKW